MCAAECRVMPEVCVTKKEPERNWQTKQRLANKAGAQNSIVSLSLLEMPRTSWQGGWAGWRDDSMNYTKLWDGIAFLGILEAADGC
jgi:hypothetical protein